MTDGAQAVVWDAIWRPFGAAHSITGSATNNLRFPGQYFLIESGLHYNWHRHYDPTIGRYVQADSEALTIGDTKDNVRPLSSQIIASVQAPIVSIEGPISPSPARNLQMIDGSALKEFVDGPSLYAYAKSSPIIKFDRTGRFIGPHTPIPNKRPPSELLQCGTPAGLSPFCQQVRRQCTSECSETSLPSRDYGFRFFNCVNRCMKRHGCPSVLG